jgi:hypothetical protein
MVTGQRRLQGKITASFIAYRHKNDFYTSWVFRLSYWWKLTNASFLCSILDSRVEISFLFPLWALSRFLARVTFSKENVRADWRAPWIRLSVKFCHVWSSWVPGMSGLLVAILIALRLSVSSVSSLGFWAAKVALGQVAGRAYSRS